MIGREDKLVLMAPAVDRALPEPMEDLVLPTRPILDLAVEARIIDAERRPLPLAL